jgi:hypothetical protein
VSSSVGHSVRVVRNSPQLACQNLNPFIRLVVFSQQIPISQVGASRFAAMLKGIRHAAGVAVKPGTRAF